MALLERGPVLERRKKFYRVFIFYGHDFLFITRIPRTINSHSDTPGTTKLFITWPFGGSFSGFYSTATTWWQELKSLIHSPRESTWRTNVNSSPKNVAFSFFCFIGNTFCNGHNRRSAFSFYTTRFQLDRLPVSSVSQGFCAHGFPLFAISALIVLQLKHIALHWRSGQCITGHGRNAQARHLL